MAFGIRNLLLKPPAPPRPKPPPAPRLAPKPPGYSNRSAYEGPTAGAGGVANPPSAQETAAVEKLPPNEQTNYWTTRTKMEGNPAGQKALQHQLLTATAPSGDPARFCQELDAVQPMVEADTSPTGASPEVMVGQYFQAIDDPSFLKQGADANGDPNFGCGMSAIVSSYASSNPVGLGHFITDLTMKGQATVNGATFALPGGKFTVQPADQRASPILQLTTPAVEGYLSSQYPGLTFDTNIGAVSFVKPNGTQVVTTLQSKMVGNVEARFRGSAPMKVQGKVEGDFDYEADRSPSADRLFQTVGEQLDGGSQPTVVLKDGDQTHYEVVAKVSGDDVVFEDGTSMSIHDFKQKADVVIYDPSLSPDVPAEYTAAQYGDHGGGHFRDGTQTNGGISLTSRGY